MFGKNKQTLTRWTGAGALALVSLTLFGLILTTCTLEPDIAKLHQEAIDATGIGYTVSANGANGSVTSDKLTFHFTKNVTTLDESDITITDGTGTAVKDGAPTGGDRYWELPITTVTRGTIKVKVSKDGIQSSIRNATVYDDRITTYTVTPNGSAGTTDTSLLTFDFDDDIRGVGLVQDDIAITTGAGTVATIRARSWTETASNDGTEFTLGVTTVSEGTITVKITKAGIDAAVQTVDVYKDTTTPTVITPLSLGITVPVTGASPYTTAISETEYTGTILWSPDDDPFLASTAYTATVSLTAESGYTFASLAANSFTNSPLGGTVTHSAGTGTTLTVTVVFSATGPGSPTTVTLSGGSDGGLTEGNTEVTGLTVTKYYKVIDGATTKYVTAVGTLSTDLSDIGLPAGGKITGLTNGNTYTVNAATPFATTPLEVFDHPDGVPPGSNPHTTKTVDATGALTLDGSGNVLWGIDLQLDTSKTYEVMRITSGSPSGSSTTASPLWTASKCSGVYDSDTDAFISDDPPKDVGIFIYPVDSGEPTWIRGMSIVYAHVDSGASSDFLIVDEDGTLKVLTVSVP